MNDEEKYKDALEMARKLQENSNGMILKKWLWNIFPELKESEDEKIRKDIKQHFLYLDDSFPDKAKWLAWLEKQGEQKTIDKLKPKFHVNEWVVTDKNDVVQIKAVNKGYYTIDNGMDFNMLYVDKYWHKWTIQDAKDGDVLQLGIVTAIFQEYIGNGNCKCYCSVCDGEFEVPSQDGDDNSYGCHNATPATKEQRDALIKAMTDAGYTFNFKTKELKEIEFNPDDIIEESHQQQADDLIDMVTEKSAWSEEDEERLQSCLNILQAKGIMGVTETINTKWLKSLKDRVQPQLKQELSEEDEIRLQRIIDFVWRNRKGDTDEIYQQEQDVDWLKSLKQKIENKL